MRCGGGHALFMHREITKHAGENMQGAKDRVISIKNRFLILLHILVVRQRNGLHGGEQPHQRTIHAPGFAPNQLGKIRVFLLRHNRAASGKVITEFDVIKLKC